MAKVIRLASISATTSGNIVVPNNQFPVVGGQRGMDFIIETTAVGTGDTWNEAVNWVSPGGVATTIGTFTNITATGTKAMTWVYAGEGNLAAPPVTQVKLTLQTAGSSSLTANLYIITDGP